MSAYIVKPAEGAYMTAFVYPDRAAALLAAGRSDNVISSLADIRWSGDTLMEVYVALGGRSKKRCFPTWREGAEQILKMLAKVAREPK